MSYTYDPELTRALAMLPDVDLADLDGTRAKLRSAEVDVSNGFLPCGVDVSERTVPGFGEEPDVPVRIYHPAGTGGRSAVLLYLHGGGFVLGGLDTVHATAAEITAETGVVVVSVRYRLAPENPFPAALKDCLCVLSRVVAGDTGVDADPRRIGVGGDSAGAGLAAGVALAARDGNGPPVGFQLLNMPALDDRLETPSMRTFVDTPLWTRAQALLSWQYYLAEGKENGGVGWARYAAPARIDDLTGLPPAYVAVCEFDPLRDEGLDYGRRLVEAGVSTEIHLYPGTFHGCTRIPRADVARRMRNDAHSAVRRALLPGSSR
ncbi:esterase [Amycolatopsis sp. WAC 04197]|uniref:alpha/beta hydrolase n=1 Tax=Amycolatopsis sp. WAC 04197 TaxID=2203199 RepID=UPI000F7B41E0|nr:alpha/beta hydrolase [Amycolatopsis sp. WAC 04197]RSN39294.1 esterase [Amycolatopsis sp. WAC 04197]